MKPSHFQLALVIFLASFTTEVNCQVNPWENIGPFMGYINSMAMDDAHPDTVYAGTPTGVYKTVDGADNWYKTSLTDIEINSIVVFQNNPNILIANSDSIVYKSDDHGETWNEIWKNTEYTIGAVAFDPSNHLSIWVGINVGTDYTQNVYHSNDGGNSWESVHFPKDVNAFGVEKEEMKLQNLLSIHFDQSNDSVLYICGWGDNNQVTGGLFVSNDKGKTWENHRPGGCSSNKVLAVATTPEGYETPTAFILVEACSISEKLFKSTDYGKTWTEVTMPNNDYIGGNPRVMKINPYNPQWLYFGANYKNEASMVSFNIEKSTWHYYPGTPSAYPTSMLINPEVWHLGFKNDGAYRWNEEIDTAWTLKVNGMNDVRIYDIITYPADPDKIMAAIKGSLAKTCNKGKTWNLSNNSFGSLALNPNDTSKVYAGKVSTYLPNWTDSYFGYRSQNGGNNWASKKLFTRGGLSEFGYTFRTGDIEVFPNNPDVILFGIDGGGGAGEGLCRSVDGGDSWTSVFSTGVTPITIDPMDNDNVYLGTTKPGSVHKSQDGGKNWESMGGVADIISDIGIDKKGEITAATSDGLYKRNGNSWSLVSGFPEINTTTIAIDNRPVLPIYYVGTEKQGVYISEDGGATWKSFNEGFKKSSITKLRLTDSNPRNLYAGTEDGSVWMTTLQKTVTSAFSLQKPETFVTVFPNPNNGSFSIVTNSNTKLNGRLKIINFLGEVIYEKNNVEINPRQAYKLNIANKIPGNYILNFTDDKQTINKKVIFINK